MDVPTLAQRREAATARRRKPSGLNILDINAESDGDHGPLVGSYPEELRLEVTYDDGQLATWFDDTWWLESLQRWKDVSLRIHIRPTPDALLHPVVIHELEMVRRMQVPWRLIGHCYLSDIGTASQATKAAKSPYDDIRVIPGDRASSEVYQVRPARMTIDELIDHVRSTQSAENVLGPLVTRAPAIRS